MGTRETPRVCRATGQGENPCRHVVQEARPSPEPTHILLASASPPSPLTQVVGGLSQDPRHTARSLARM